jgi:hypothetical protein
MVTANVAALVSSYIEQQTPFEVASKHFIPSGG